MKTKHLLFLIVSLVIFSGCADAQNVESCVIEEPYGFFSGIWHGLIMPISFFISLFDQDVAIYAVNNNGGWYDFGFWLGVSGWFGGSYK